jgi:hypothetical protein
MIIERAKITQELLESLTAAIHDENGFEYTNPIPFEPEGLRPAALSLRERVQRILRTELSRQAESQDFESFDEANDFDIPDAFDAEPGPTPYEQVQEEIMEEPSSSDEPEGKPAEPPEGETDQPEGLKLEDEPVNVKDPNNTSS